MEYKHIKSGRYHPRLKAVVMGDSDTEDLENVWKTEVDILVYVEKHPVCKTTALYQSLKVKDIHARRALHRLYARGAVRAWRGGNAEGVCGAPIYLELADGWNSERIKAMRAPQENHVGKPIISQRLSKFVSTQTAPFTIEAVMQETGFSRHAVTSHINQYVAEGKLVPVRVASAGKGRKPTAYQLAGVVGDSTLHVFRESAGQPGETGERAAEALQVP